MTKFFKFGREWFTTRKEVEEKRKQGESVYYDFCQEAYYIRKTRKSFWSFLKMKDLKYIYILLK